MRRTRRLAGLGAIGAFTGVLVMATLNGVGPVESFGNAFQAALVMGVLGYVLGVVTVPSRNKGKKGSKNLHAEAAVEAPLEEPQPKPKPAADKKPAAPSSPIAAEQATAPPASTEAFKPLELPVVELAPDDEARQQAVEEGRQPWQPPPLQP